MPRHIAANFGPLVSTTYFGADPKKILRYKYTPIVIFSLVHTEHTSSEILALFSNHELPTFNVPDFDPFVGIAGRH